MVCYLRGVPTFSQAHRLLELIPYGDSYEIDRLAVSLVVARLIGGLGNQMFQYAAGRALALRHGAELKLDVSGFDAYKRRRYELGTLSINATVATDRDLAIFGADAKPRWPLVDRVRRRVRMPGKVRALPVYREPHFHFDPAIATLRPPVYLDGYWQSERYFSDYAATLRRELVAGVPFDPENATVAARIDAVTAVSLHVRRGDYVDDPKTSRYHGTCSLDYYRRAVEHIAARVGSPHLFVFSDDAQWTRANLHVDVPTTFVDANPADRGFRDMQLMSRCRHHVVANSSFSWWGAWLGPSTDKIVVAPKRWFNAGGADTRDLIPATWVRL
jgi:glycosyl transferase family 11